MFFLETEMSGVASRMSGRISIAKGLGHLGTCDGG